jgi:hypothetical protein
MGYFPRAAVLLLLTLGGGLRLSASLLYTFQYIPSASEPEIPAFTFSLTLPNYVTTDGGFSISPIIDPEGFDLTQADFENYGSFIDMRFGTASATFTRTTTGETPPAIVYDFAFFTINSYPQTPGTTISSDVAVVPDVSTPDRDDGTGSLTISGIPEPGSGAMFLAGLTMLGVFCCGRGLLNGRCGGVVQQIAAVTRHAPQAFVIASQEAELHHRRARQL